MRMVEARLGPAPRDVPCASYSAHTPKEDELSQLSQKLPRILRRGRLARGYVYMANSGLFEPGQTALPAGVIYSFDPAVWRQPMLFEAVGRQLYGFYGGQAGWSDKPPLDPALRRLLDDHHTGMKRNCHQRIPMALTGGWTLYYGDVMGFREHLPGGCLLLQHLPLLVDLTHTPPLAMIVPAEFWPEPLIRLALSAS